MTRAVMATAVAAIGLMLVVAVAYSVKAAVLGMATIAILAALMRLFAPTRWAFGVRSRGVDIAVLLVLGGALVVLGLTTVLD